MIDLNNQKLELNYPCKWAYKLVVLESTNVKKIVESILIKKEFELKVSNVSSKGKFKSYSLELLVHSEDERKEIYALLHGNDKLIRVL